MIDPQPEVLEGHGIRSTFFVPGYTAHRYPDVVRRLVDAGHEIAHHGNSSILENLEELIGPAS